MTVALRPMNLGEILDRTFQIYRSRFLVFAGIAALPALAMMGMDMAGASLLHANSIIRPLQRSTVLWSFFVRLGFFHVLTFLALVISPAQVYVASVASLGGRGSIPTALRFAAARWRSYLWLAVLKLFAELVISETLFLALLFGMALIAVLAGSFNGGPEMGTATVLLIVALPAIAGCILFFWLGSCLSLAVPACALEGVGGVKALRRSWALSRGSRARIILSWLMIVVFSWLLMYGVQLTNRWAFPYLCRAPFLGAWAREFYYPEVYLLFAAVSALTGSIYPIAITLFYYDQRIRHEGYDIVRMMEEAGMTAPSNPPSGDSSIAPAAEESLP